jgi:hypothetical protein
LILKGYEDQTVDQNLGLVELAGQKIPRLFIVSNELLPQSIIMLVLSKRHLPVSMSIFSY